MHLSSCDSGSLKSIFAISVRARMFRSVRLMFPAGPLVDQMIESESKLSSD